MDSSSQQLPRLNSPHLSRKKRPVRHAVYVNSPDALKVRARRVSTLVNAAIKQIPSLAQFVPTVRKWAELEVIRQAAFAGLVQTNGILTSDGKDITVRRLVHDHRQLALAQLVFERELGLTPMAAANLRADGAAAALDLAEAANERISRLAPVDGVPDESSDESEPD